MMTRRQQRFAQILGELARAARFSSMQLTSLGYTMSSRTRKTHEYANNIHGRVQQEDQQNPTGSRHQEGTKNVGIK